MRLPEVSAELVQIGTRIAEIAAGNGSNELAVAAARIVHLAQAEIPRKPPLPRSHSTSTPMSGMVAQMIRRAARDYPELSHREIAEALKIHPGRVSEVLAGKRK
jgi:hypothetical protein